MLKLRHAIIVLGLMSVYPATASADVSIGIGFPHVSIGINVPTYPRLVRVPGYPVYYAPQMRANFFFYDGMYWIFHNDNWYASTWYNGPWAFVSPYEVPVFVLRIPVRYYRSPPTYFRHWRRDDPPRWRDQWGDDWDKRRHDWDRWDRRSAPTAAPLPTYQRQYSRDNYPRQVEQQYQYREQNYRYQPREPVVQRHYEETKAKGRGPGMAPAPGRGPDQDRYRDRDRDQDRDRRY